MDNQSRTCFVALVVSAEDPELHITIATTSNASNHEIKIMQQDLERKVRPYLPIEVKIGNFRMRGSYNDVQTYDCTFTDTIVSQVIATFYEDNYRAAYGKRMFPVLEPHITVDTTAKLNLFEAMIVEQQGVFTVVDTIFSTRSDSVVPAAAAAVPSSPPRPMGTETWVCPECKKWNPISSKECAQFGCDQWRPKKCMPGRVGDWECCGETQFASRSNCRRCGNAKTGSLQGVYSAPPYPMDAASAPPPPPENPRAKQKHKADWTCPGCGDNQWARNKRCRMCSTERPL
jgi:hypothetical protein